MGKRVDVSLKSISIVALSVVLAIGLSACGSKNMETAAVATVAPTPSPTIAPTPSPAATPTFAWETAEVNEANVKQALSSGIKYPAIPVNNETFRKFAVSTDTRGSYVEISVNPGLFGNEKEFAQMAAASLLAYSAILYKNPNVYEVSVVAKIDASTDTGKKGENDGVYISWRRDNAKDVVYKTLMDDMTLGYTKVFSIARKYTINKELYAKIPDIGVPQMKDSAK